MKVTKKMKRFAALLIAAVVMLSGVPLPSVQAAGDAKGVDVLEFTVKNEKGNPVPGVKLEIYDGNTSTYKKLTSNASGMVRWTPEISDEVFAGRTLTVKPVGPETTDAPLTFEMEYIYSGVGRIEIKTINGQPASEVSDPVLVVKGGAAETQDNKKQLVVNVKDQKGNPVDGCAFVMKDSAWPNNSDGMAKYPSNGVVKFTLTDSSQLGGIIRVHSWSSADYEGNELTFTSKNREFLTVNGEEYDGIKEYTIVVTKKGEKPEVNKDELKKAIDVAKAIENKNYTEASWNALQDAIAAAEAVRDDADATQNVVDAQVTALEEAINGLKVNTPQGNKKVLVVRVEDKDGNPVDGCAFVIKDSAFPNVADGMAKYPSNGVVKFTLTDSSQLGGIIRVHSWSSADYEGNELTFTSKNREFLTVNGEEYDGIKEYTIVVTKKGEEPEKPEVNKEDLEQKITDAKAIKNENYTEASWNALRAAITAAEAVRDNADATQDDVDAQVTVLEEAISGLKVNTPQGNKKVLVVRVEDKDGNPVDGCAFVIKDSAFPNVADGMAKYPSNGVVKFTLTDSSQLGGIIRVHSWSSADYEGNELTFTSKNREFLTVNGEEYDGIKEYTIVVTKKGEEPEKPEVNKEDLEQKITDAKAIKNENYTEASWNALQAAITAAEAVRDDADATQDDVDAQVTALETAINALEEKEPEKPEEVNKDELKKAIDAAKAIENKNYTEASWNALQAAIAAAEAVRNDADATQDDVDAQVTALKNAVDGLKENSEKPNPEKPNPEKPNTNKPNTNKPNIDKPNADKNENAAPKTGDSAPFVPCVAGMICAAAVAGMALKKRKSFE